MANIDVLVTAQGVAAEPNLASVNRTEEVTWTFRPISIPDPFPFPLPFKIVFQSGGDPFFPPLSRVGDTIIGTISIHTADGLYFYQIFDATNKIIPWLNAFSDDHNFGGVEVHGPPPQQ
jgi:hypothetical protein